VTTGTVTRARRVARSITGVRESNCPLYRDDAARRGRLHFWDIRIELLAPDAAQLVGRYRLEGGSRPQEGINTRLFRKVDGRWVIALNHVSSREQAPPSVPAGR
jgi:hypothetical protein